MKPPPVFLPVTVNGPTDISTAGHRQVVFHGTNKSGSLAFVRAMREAYHQAGRQAEFVTTYGAGLASEDELAAVAANSHGPALFSAHYLLGRIPPRSDRIFTTIIRHPLPRAVSIHQWHIKRLNERNPAAAADFPDLETWLLKGKKDSFFATTQFGIGYGPDCEQLREQLKTGEVLQRAKSVLKEQITALAVAERFEESIFLFAHILGLQEVPLWLRDRRNSGRRQVETLPTSTIQLIQNVFEPDFEFYEWAVREVFKPQMNTIDFGQSLAEYQRRCASQYNDRILI